MDISVQDLPTASTPRETLPTGAEMVRKSAATGNTAGPIRVGRATVIQQPYTGATPASDPSTTRIVPNVPAKSLETAQTRIADARNKASLTGRSARKFLTMAYEELFPQRRDIPVSGLTMDGEPYVVSIHKSAIGKIISDKNMTPEKLAVMDVLDDIVKNGEFVGSGKYIPAEGKNAKNTIRFDYFETQTTINGKPFLVTFDVEVFPGHNNYRTHKVINEMDLVPLPSGEVGTDQPQSLEGKDPSGDIVPQTKPGVKPQTSGKVLESGITEGMAALGMEPVSKPLTDMGFAQSARSNIKARYELGKALDDAIKDRHVDDTARKIIYDLANAKNEGDRRMEYFDPRSPRGERRRHVRVLPCAAQISIHAPLAGSDCLDSSLFSREEISIHAPLAGSDHTTTAAGVIS